MRAAKDRLLSTRELDYILYNLGFPGAAPRRFRGKGHSKPAGPRSRAPVFVHELDITVADVQPCIWRRVSVPSKFTLAQLHAVLQIVMDWHDCQSHMFLGRGGLYGPPGAKGGPAWAAQAADEGSVRVCDVLPEAGTEVVYSYPANHGWILRVDAVRIGLSEAGTRYPCCRAGERAGPPEGVGGMAGFHERLKALASARHKGRDRHSQRLGPDFDPQAFDVQAVNRRLAMLR